MHTKKPFLPTSLLLSFVAALALVLYAGAAVPPAEKLLPDDTLVLFSIPDFSKARDIFNNSPQGQLWRDPSLKAFKDKFMDKVKDQFIAPLERDLSVHLDDYTSLLQGQLTLAVVQDGWMGKDTKDKEPAVLLLVDTKDKSSLLKTNLADLRKKWVDAGKKVRADKIRDVEFSVVTITTNDLPKTLKKDKAADGSSPDQAEALDNADAKKSPFKNEVYVGQSDSLLIVGQSQRAIEKVLARLGGADVKTVSDVPSFEGSQPMFKDSPLYGWVNTKVFVDILTHSADAGDDSASPLGVSMAKVVAAVGLNGLKSISVGYHFSDDGALGTLFLNVPESSRTGIFKILAGEPKEYTPPPFVPINAVKFQRWRIDGQKTWATIQKILNDINPQWLNGLNLLLSTTEGAAKEKNPDFDIKKNLFGNLGDDVIIYSKSPKGDRLADLNSAPSLTLIGSPNAEQLVGALRNLLSFMGTSASPTEREFLGHKIYSLPLPGMPNAKGTTETRTISYAFSGGYLAIGSEDSVLEEYLRSSQGDAKSLRDTPGLSDAMQKVAGPGTSIFSYSNDSETVRVAFEAVRKDFDSLLSDSSMGPIIAATGLTNGTKLKEWFDVSLLPSYDKISKYFSFSVFAETASPEGLAFKGYTPTPSVLKQQAAAGK
jgi:hypothetical protein